jgi:hypothetical protein
MTKGILIYAHNSKKVDYLDLALISGSLSSKNLNLPVSLVTDKSTLEWAKESKKYKSIERVFDNIILSEDYFSDASRKLYDGIDYKEDVPFLNKNRCNAWNLTPYENTLLIDSDFLIFSNLLNEYWNIDADFMISPVASDVFIENRLEYNDRYISEVGIKMCWATTIMFKKNQFSKALFDLVELIRDNYTYFADLYRFDHRMFRNDIAFSIAQHILNGNKSSNIPALPPILTTIDKDILIDVKEDKLFFLISSKYDNSYTVCSKKNQDVHIMNKQSIVRNKQKLLELG